MSTKDEVSPTRKNDKCLCNKDFLNSKDHIEEEEDIEEDIEEMSNSLADLKVEQENSGDDSTLNPNMEEIKENGEFNVIEVDIVEKEAFVTVDDSEVDPLETGDHEVFEKSARRKKLEKLKREIEKVKQNLKDEEEKEPTKAKKNLKDHEEQSDDDAKAHKKLKKHRGASSAPVKKKSTEGVVSTLSDTSPKNPPAEHQVSRQRFRPGPTPGTRKFPGFHSPPKMIEMKEPLETESEGILQSVESKAPFPMWPESVGGALEAARKARKEKLRQFRVMRALRRYNMPTERTHEPEEEVFSSLTDEREASKLEATELEKRKIDQKRCSQTDCKKKVGLTGFACRCLLLFCPLHRCVRNISLPGQKDMNIEYSKMI